MGRHIHIMYTAPPANAPVRRPRPSLLWLILPVALILGAAFWMVFGFIGLNNQVNSLQRVPFPGQGEVTLPHSGSYVVYYEGPGASHGVVPSGHIDVRPLTPGAAAKSLTTYSARVTYNIGSHSGTAVDTLTISGPGRFLVATTAQNAPAGSVIAIGGSIGGSIVATVVPAIILLLAGIGGAIAIPLLRRRGRRAAAPTWPGYPGGISG
jgi:hypothetical protein